jgi:hypothetical protein
MRKSGSVAMVGLTCLLALCHGCQEDGPDERLVREAPIVLWQEWSMSHHPFVAMKELAKLRREVGSAWDDIPIGLRMGSYSMNADDLCCLGYWEDAAEQYMRLHEIGGPKASMQAWLAYAASMSHNQDLQKSTSAVLKEAESRALAACVDGFSEGSVESLFQAKAELEPESHEFEVMCLLKGELLLLQGAPRRAWRSVDDESRDRLERLRLVLRMDQVPMSREMNVFYLYRAALIAHAAGSDSSALELASAAMELCGLRNGKGDIVCQLMYKRLQPLVRLLEQKVV